MTTARVDCTCPKSRHQHGTEQAYQSDACRCSDCREAHRIRRNQDRRLDAIRRWHGLTSLVDATGTRRRLQALAADGWRLADVADRLGVGCPYVAQLRAQAEVVNARTAARVASVYDAMGTAPDGRGHNFARAIARRNGWHPSIAWDDDTIDDPNAKPYASAPVDIDEIAVEQACNGRRVHLTRAERLAAVATLTERGYSEKQISELLGYPARTVARDKAAIRGQDAA